MAEALPKLIMIGAGGLARVIADTLALLGRDVVGHISPELGDSDLLGTHLGGDDKIPGLAERGFAFVMGVGFADAATARRRTEILERLAAVPLLTVVSPSAIVSPTARLGSGVFVAPGAIVGTGSTVDNGTIIYTGAIVDHDCRIGANCLVATGAALAGGVTVGSNSLIGVGACARNTVTIGDNVIVGAGAVVIRDIDDGLTVVGNPARAIGGGQKP